MTSAVYAGVREILAAPDWEPVTVTDHGQFFTISGYFRSMAHTGSRKDWESLARDLDRIAREQHDALMGKAEPALVISADAYNTLIDEMVEGHEPAPEPQPDPRDAELEAMRAEIDALRAAKRELEERELELKDANASLKDALSDIEDRIADLDEDDDAHKFPAPDERLSDWDMVGVSDTERGVLKTAMEDGESVGAAKRRLYPILNEELSRLQNQEALLGASTPESVSARRKEVESLLGILARVGDA